MRASAPTRSVSLLVAGKLGLQTPQMAVGSLIAISGGLIVAAPAAITGLLDWLDMPKGTPARTTATLHLVTMVTATVLFVVTWLLQRPGYIDSEVCTSALIVGLIAEATLAVGGYIGGTIVFVYGNRVVNRTDAPVADALTPGRVEHRPAQPPRTEV
jgi:uncharacterized membrane protein